jgi:hypothetical protein
MITSLERAKGGKIGAVRLNAAELGLVSKKTTTTETFEDWTWNTTIVRPNNNHKLGVIQQTYLFNRRSEKT